MPMLTCEALHDHITFRMVRRVDTLTRLLSHVFQQVSEYDLLLLEFVFGQRPDDAAKVSVSCRVEALHCRGEHCFELRRLCAICWLLR